MGAGAAFSLDAGMPRGAAAPPAEALRSDFLLNYQGVQPAAGPKPVCHLWQQPGQPALVGASTEGWIKTCLGCKAQAPRDAFSALIYLQATLN